MNYLNREDRMDNKLTSGFSSLFTAAKNIASGVDQYVQDDVYNHRLDLCNTCPKLIPLKSVS